MHGNSTIYLDNNATTAVHPAVVAAMQPFWSDSFANANSAHRSGQHARRAIDAARECIAACLDATPEEVIFTPSATIANNLALWGLGELRPGTIISSPLEHPSVLESLRELARQRGHFLKLLSVNSHGLINPFDLSSGSELRLVGVQWANHEIGVVQNLPSLVSQFPSIPFHCDATQAVGRIPVSFRAAGVTSLSFSAHKFHGPKGIGCLLLRQGHSLRPLWHGGDHPGALLPGTEPVALIVGMAKALDMACRELADRVDQIRQLRTLFLSGLQQRAGPFLVNGSDTNGVPHTVNLSFPGCDAATLFMKLDLAGVACSTGAACASGSHQPSPVLQALGLTPEVVQSALRFSLCHFLTADEVLDATQRIAHAVRTLRFLRENGHEE